MSARGSRKTERPLSAWPVVAATSAVMCALPLVEWFRLRLIGSGDFWRSLGCGQWMLQHFAVPRSGVLSQFPGLRWSDSSWALDALQALFYRAAGLAGVEAWQFVLLAALAASVLFAAFSLARSVWPALGVSALALALLANGSAALSPMFFVLELALLFAALEKGARHLRWLPLVFTLWANFDAGFLLGLAVLVWLPAALTLDRLLRTDDAEATLTPLAALQTAGLSAAACMVSPYGWRSYAPLEWIFNGHAYNYIATLHAPSFRHAEDYLATVFLLLGFFALGRRHTRSLFAWGVIASTAAAACAVQELRWAGIISAGVALALWLRRDAPQQDAVRPLLLPTGAASLAVLLVLCASLSTRSESLHEHAFRRVPSAAAQFLRQSQLPGPLFHEYEWGNYLLFALPEYPVAIDGRAELYGDERNLAFMAAVNGRQPVDSLDTFRDANLLLLRSGSQLAAAIGRRPDFVEVYRDEHAVVLRRVGGAQ